MKKRKLGNSDLEFLPIIFGGNVFGWTIDEKTSFTLLDAFFGAGFQAIDTADVYSRWAQGNTGGESEIIIGNWMQQKKKRDQVILMTKVGSDMGDGNKGLKKDYILRAVDASLTRLKTDYIDLYQTHFDEESTSVEETLSVYDELVRSGKVRFIGTSNMSPARIRSSMQISQEKNYPKYQSLQPHYNLYAREKFEKQYQELAKEFELGVIPYFSLESGFLTGKYRTDSDLGKSPRGSDMNKYFDKRGLAILEALDKISAKHGVQQASVALSWLLYQPTITAPIASATQLSQLSGLISAVQLQLDSEDLELLNTASSY